MRQDSSSRDDQLFLHMLRDELEVYEARVAHLGQDVISSTKIATRRLVLKYGFTCHPAPRPKTIRKSKNGQCQMNAWNLASQENSFIYTEGFAYRPGQSPMDHSWCIDTDLRVIDPTWAKPETCHYVGVPLKTLAVTDLFLIEAERSAVMVLQFLAANSRGERGGECMLTARIEKMMHPRFRKRILGR